MEKFNQLKDLLTEATNDAVKFYEKARGVAPGQSAVFYEDEDVIGGGIIQSGILNP